MVAYISTWYSLSKIIDLKHKNIYVIKPVMNRQTPGGYAGLIKCGCKFH